MTNLRLLLPLLLALMLTGVAKEASEPKPSGSPSALNYVPTGKDEQGLWADADEGERELKTSKIVIRDPVVDAYLRQVLCRVVGVQSCQAIRIYLVRLPLFNADMSANGMMRVYSGLLLRVRDEAELAAILGHEFEHFEHRHSLYGLRKHRSAMSWGAWLTVASTLGTQPRNFVTDFLSAYFAYSRDQEREADLGGITRISSAGYRPIAASRVWQRMREEQDAQARGLGVRSLKDADYGPFASHPMNLERMTYLARAGQSLQKDQDFDGARDYRAALSSIWPMLIDDQIKLNDFGGSEYLLANLAGSEWTAPLLYARGELYRARGTAVNLLTAETFFRQALVLPDAPAAIWRGLGLVLSRNGQRDEARQCLLKYLELNPSAPDKVALRAIAEGN